MPRPEDFGLVPVKVVGPKPEDFGLTPVSPEQFGLTPTTPGSSPENPLQEQGVQDRERKVIKYFAQKFGNEAVIKWLQKPPEQKAAVGMQPTPLEMVLSPVKSFKEMGAEQRQYDAVENSKGEIAVRPKGSNEPWRVVDPAGFDFGDLSDLAPEALSYLLPGGKLVKTAASMAGADVAEQIAGAPLGVEAPIEQRLASPVIAGAAGGVAHGIIKGGGAALRQVTGRGKWYSGVGKRPSFRVTPEGNVVNGPIYGPELPPRPQPEVRPPWTGAPDVPAVAPGEAAAARQAPDEYVRGLTQQQAEKVARFQALAKNLTPEGIAEMKALAREIDAAKAELDRLAGRATPAPASRAPKPAAAPPPEAPATTPWEAAPDAPPAPKALPAAPSPTGNPELDKLLAWQRELQTGIQQGKDFSPEELAQVPKNLLRIQQIRSGKSTAPPSTPVEPDDELVARLKARMSKAKNWTNQSLEEATEKWDAAEKAHRDAGLPIPEHSIPVLRKLPGEAFTPRADLKDLKKYDIDHLRLRAEMARIPGARDLPREDLEAAIMRNWNKWSDIHVESRVKGWDLTNSAGAKPYEMKFFESTKKEGYENRPRRGLFANAAPVGSTREIPREVVAENFEGVPDDALDHFAAQIVPKREGVTQKSSTFASRLAKLRKMDREEKIDYIWKEGYQALQGKGMPYDPKAFGNRIVYDLENDSWRSIPLDRAIAFKKPGEAEVDLLARKNIQVAGTRGKIGRGLMEMGTKVRAPAEWVSNKLERGLEKVGADTNPLFRYSLRRTMGVTPIFGASLASGLMYGVPGAAPVGAILGGSQIAGNAMRSLGRAIQYDTGSIVSRLLHAKDPGVARTAKYLQEVLQNEGIKAYRDLLLAQMVIDPAFRAAVGQ